MKFIKMIAKEHPIKKNEKYPLFTGYVIDKKGNVYSFSTYAQLPRYITKYSTASSWEVKVLKYASWSIPHYSVHVNYLGTGGKYVDGVYQRKEIISTRLLLRVDNFTKLSEGEGASAVLNSLL